MESKDFMIENGVLTRYAGSGGDVTIPEGVAMICESTFEDCASLRSVTIPEGVAIIDASAFAGCTGLQSVTIPASVTEIGWKAFAYCSDLQSVTILARRVEIDKQAFEDSCPVLIAPNIPISGFCAKDKPGACCGFAKLMEAGAEVEEEIKAGYLKYIKGQRKRLYPLAVRHEELLRLMLTGKMLIRKDVELLLEECERQGSITAKAELLEYADKNLEPLDVMKEMERGFAAIERAGKNREEFLATGVMKVGEAKKLFRYKKLEAGGLIITGYKGTEPDVLLPEAIGKDAVEEIDEEAFRGCTVLQSVTIPEGMLEIGESAFEGCSGLRSVTIPSSVMCIDSQTFFGCTSLRSVRIAEGIGTIGYCAFRQCESLQSVVIPKSVYRIDPCAFSECYSLQSVTIPTGVSVISESTFYSCASLQSVEIPEGVLEIEWIAFRGCASLRSVVIPRSVQKIGSWAFQDCTNLRSVTIPNTATRIAIFAFIGCENLTIHAPAGSDAERYAKENGISFEVL